MRAGRNAPMVNGLAKAVTGASSAAAQRAYCHRGILAPARCFQLSLDNLTPTRAAAAGCTVFARCDLIMRLVLELTLLDRPSPNSDAAVLERCLNVNVKACRS